MLATCLIVKLEYTNHATSRQNCVGGCVGGFPNRFQETCPMESQWFLKLLVSTATLSAFLFSQVIPYIPKSSQKYSFLILLAFRKKRQELLFPYLYTSAHIYPIHWWGIFKLVWEKYAHTCPDLLISSHLPGSPSPLKLLFRPVISCPKPFSSLGFFPF